VFGVNREGLRRQGVSSDVQRQLHHAFRILFHSKLAMKNALAQVAKSADQSPEVHHLISFIRASKRGIARA
jgi:UDP-N-acetylglucosamine acyltransferase